MKQFTTAFEDAEAEDSGEGRKAVKFQVDDRVLTAHQPTEGQLIFLMASLGRGQSQESRFASIINVVLSTLDDADADYLEGRLLSKDPEQMVRPKTIEAIFEHLMEEWFGDPTQSQSDSAESQPNDGPNSSAPTT